MKRKSKLAKLLDFDLFAMKNGSPQIAKDMIQLTFFEKEYECVIGVDEVGRGCLAGPVMASAVSYRLKELSEIEKTQLKELDDSKRLSEKQRSRLSDAIRSSAQFAIGHVSNEDIDKFNILNASMLAMEKAVHRLILKLESDGIKREKMLVLVDGKQPMPGIKIAQLPVSKGDLKSASIASASILAKVTRDKLMQRYYKKYPNYFWNKNKGYPSRVHVDALKKLGPSPMHRLSFSWS